MLAWLRRQVMAYNLDRTRRLAARQCDLCNGSHLVGAHPGGPVRGRH